MKLTRTLSSLFASTILVTTACVAADNSTPSLAAAIQLEDAFNAVAVKARDAVVVITNIQYNNGMQEMPQDFNPFEEFFGPQFRFQRGIKPRRRSLAPVNSGSGAIISKDGYIVTNCHVIDNCEFLQVKLADGTIYDNQKNADDVKIVGMDKESDLAVLQLANGKKNTFTALEFTDSNKLRIGQWAIAVGAPHQLEQSVTFGHVSQIGRHNPGISAFNNYIQTDAPLNPGNSGGPLLDIHGNIIGINEYIQTDGMGRGNIGLGFAIAANVVKAVSDELIQNGEVARPFIGIQMQDLTPELQSQFGTDYGVIVAEVIAGEAAEKAGLKSGDVIIAVNGKKINNSQEMLTAIANYKPGDNLDIQFVRGEKKQNIIIEARKRALADNSFKGRAPSQAEVGQFDKLGLELAVKDQKVIIQDIDPEGAAAAASERMTNGLRVKDVILDVNRQPVKNINDVKDALRFTRNNTVMLLIERTIHERSSRLYIAIPLN